jgi:transposase
MATRRLFSREFKLEAVKLVVECGVFVAQAGKDLDVHENVLRKWVREAKADPQHAFPGQGVMRPEMAELEHLRKENAKLKMERDLLEKQRPTSPRSRCEVRLHGEAPMGLACGDDERGARCAAQWLLCLTVEAAKPTLPR